MYISAILQTALNVKGYPHLPVSFYRRLQFSEHKLSQVESFHAITIDAKHLYFTVGVSSTLLFFLREINRFLETLSSFCIFEKALFLETRDSILETRDSILETRSSNVSSIEARGSSLEVRVSSVNLLLSGTVNI